MFKKTTFFVTILFFISSLQILSAQNNENIYRKQSEYGFRLGLNYSDIDFEDGDIVPGGSQDPRYGFMAGFFGIFHLSETISIQPEIQFSAQGEKASAASDFNGINFFEDELRINLLQIPIFVNYTIADKFIISAGPQLGLNVWEWERQNDYQPIQFSGVAGVAYKFTDNVSVALRGSFGITDAIDADNSGSFEVEQGGEPLFVANGKNHYLQLSVAYQL